MSSIIGVLCSDGVVIGADSCTTFGPCREIPTIEQRFSKIHIIVDNFILAGTGEIGFEQRFHNVLSQAWGREDFQRQSAIQITKELARLNIEDMARTYMKPGNFGALVAFPATGTNEITFHFCEFRDSNFQPQFMTTQMWFASMGRGQSITDPFLAFLKRVFWNETQPVISEGIFAVTWTLQHVIELNTGGISGPPLIAVLKPGPAADPRLRAELLDNNEIAEQVEKVRAAEEHLREYKQMLASGDDLAPPAGAPA